MKLSKKKTCNGCKSLNRSSDNCDLGFKIRLEHQANGFGLTRHFPVDECWKPKTSSEWLQAIDLCA